MFIVVNRTSSGIISVLDTDDMKVDKFQEYELIRLIESHSIHVAGFYTKQGLHYISRSGADYGYVSWKCVSIYGRVVVPSLNLKVYSRYSDFTGLQQTLLRSYDCSENGYSKSLLQSFLYDIYQYKINGKDTFMSIKLHNKEEIWGRFLRDIVTKDTTIVPYKNKVIFTDGDLCIFIDKEKLSPSANKRGEVAKIAVLNGDIGLFDPVTRSYLLRDFKNKSLIVKQDLKYKFTGQCKIDKLHIMNNKATFVLSSVSTSSTVNDFYCTDVDICKKFFEKFNILETCACPLDALFYLPIKTTANVEIVKTDDIEGHYESLKSNFDRFFSNYKKYAYFIPYDEINYFRQINRVLFGLGYPEYLDLSDYRLDMDYDFVHDSAKFCNISNIDDTLNILGLNDKNVAYKIFSHYLNDDCKKLEYVVGRDYASSEFYSKTLIPTSGKKFINRVMRAYNLHNEIKRLFGLDLTCYYNTDWRAISYNKICFDIPVSKLPFVSQDSVAEICTLKDCGILKKVLDSLYDIYNKNKKFRCKIFNIEESTVTIAVLSGYTSRLLSIQNLKVKNE